MYIHLADTSKERGQYKLLVEELYPACLLSYAYKNCESYFGFTWDRLMQLHLAATGPGFLGDILADESTDRHLMSFAYKQDESGIYSKPWGKKDVRPRVIIDSGAFTAWSSGKPFNPDDYADWALEFRVRWVSKMAALHFMNLDVIGDQDATWINQKILEKRGLNPLPIVTFGADFKHLEQALAEYEYIALGGLVPHTRNRPVLQNWLDSCFKRIVNYRNKTGVLRKVHLLGVTTDWVLKRYPCYSSDSSSWVACLRYGEGKAGGLKKIPRYKESDAAMAATLHTLRAEINRFRKMQDEATNLWSTRGVIWND